MSVFQNRFALHVEREREPRLRRGSLSQHGGLIAIAHRTNQIIQSFANQGESDNQQRQC